MRRGVAFRSSKRSAGCGRTSIDFRATYNGSHVLSLSKGAATTVVQRPSTSPLCGSAQDERTLHVVGWAVALRIMLRRLLILLALLLAPAFAQARGIAPELVAEGPAPPGGEVELAIHMRPEPGWHGYWLNPGDAGLPMDVQWKLPTGFAAGPLRYPVPGRLE